MIQNTSFIDVSMKKASQNGLPWKFRTESAGLQKKQKIIILVQMYQSILVLLIHFLGQIGEKRTKYEYTLSIFFALD